MLTDAAAVAGYSAVLATALSFPVGCALGWWARGREQRDEQACAARVRDRHRQPRQIVLPNQPPTPIPDLTAAERRTSLRSRLDTLTARGIAAAGPDGREDWTAALNAGRPGRHAADADVS